jgi:hypothetical protein
MAETGTNNEALNDPQENDAFMIEDEKETQENGKFSKSYIHIQLDVNHYFLRCM